MLFIMLLLAGTVAVSYRYSNEIYRFYITTWQVRIRGENRESLLEQGWQQLAGEHHDEAAETAAVVDLLHPGDPEAMALAGLALVQRGEDDRGLGLVSTAVADGWRSPEPLPDIVALMFKQGLHADLVAVYGSLGPPRGAQSRYRYQVSLYHAGKPGEARAGLERLVRTGRGELTAVQQARLYHTLALIYEKDGNIPAAIRAINAAGAAGAGSHGINETAVRLYRKAGDYGGAGEILRRGMGR